MDIGALWAGLMGSFPKNWGEVLGAVQELMANPWTRTLALVVIVYFTIRVIASIYSGDKQGAELGPVAIREHPSSRYDDNTVRLPRDLMSMNMDGVSANCQVLYVYMDAKGRRRRRVVHRQKDIRLSISPQRIRRTEKIDGQEIPDVPTTFVCFPPFESDEPPETISPMHERAREYARHHKILENWHDDDGAQLIACGTEFMQQVASGKEQFIRERVDELAKLKKGTMAYRFNFQRLRNNRPNVVGSYYLKFEFSHEPLFVLTRHPDRDLKMTAWLTILTSMFALIMDWWPMGAAPFGMAGSTEIVRAVEGVTPSRAVRVP